MAQITEYPSASFLQGFYAFHMEMSGTDNPYVDISGNKSSEWLKGFRKAGEIYSKDSAEIRRNMQEKS